MLCNRKVSKHVRCMYSGNVAAQLPVEVLESGAAEFADPWAGSATDLEALPSIHGLAFKVEGLGCRV